MARHFVHDGLPGARAKSRVMGGQVGASKRKVQRRLLVRLILGINEPLRLGTVFRAQVASVGGAILLPIENASGALIGTVFELRGRCGDESACANV